MVDGTWNIDPNNDDVHQPYETSPKIGFVSTAVFDDDCDCAFVQKTSSDSWYEGRIWYGSNSYTTISWYTDRVANGAYVILTGGTSGPVTGIVNDRYSTALVSKTGGGYYYFDVVELTTAISQNYDSGGPYTNTAKNNFYGVHKGIHPQTNNSMFIPWENIETQLGL